MQQLSRNLKVVVRPVDKNDQHRLVTLLHFENHVHRHLDWISPIDLIDSQPFYVLEQEGQVHAALACPVDPPGVSWIRLFLASGSVSYEAVWQLLWSKARKALSTSARTNVSAIAIHPWFSEMLERSKFKRMQEVVFLNWQAEKNFSYKLKSKMPITEMRKRDLPEIHEVDKAAFGLIWQNSLESLSAAYKQSHFATIVRDEIGIVGYQISTAGHLGGHLARLAVHPRRQGQRIGYDLLIDVLRRFHEINIDKVSVNTQEENVISINLYQKVGFTRTGESYGVYEYLIN